MKTLSALRILIPIYLFTLTFVFNSCQNDKENQTMEQAEHTGEELFRGIFLLQGSFTEELPSRAHVKNRVESLLSQESSLANETELFADDLISTIQLLDPEYFSNFKNQILSKDYYTVSLAITNAAEVIKTAGLSSERYGSAFQIAEEMDKVGVDLNSEQLANMDLNNKNDIEALQDWLEKEYGLDVVAESDTGIALAIVVAVALAVVVNSVGAINLFYAWNITQTSTETGGGGGDVTDPFAKTVNNRDLQILVKEISNALK